MKTAKIQLLNKYGDSKPVKREDMTVQSILGASFEKPSPDLMAKLNLDHGLQIINIEGGPLQRAGIKKILLLLK